MYEICPFVPPYELPHWGVMEGVFSHDEVDRIRFFQKVLEFVPGTTVGLQSGDMNEDENRQIRSCELAALPIDDNTSWLWEKIGYLSGKANYDLFMYDINALECLQYTIYNGTSEDHYHFHRDSKLCGYRSHDRKITGILMLSDADEYEGGDLRVDIGGDLKPTTVKLNKGDVLFFDSNYSHAVENVTSGVRQTLVFWIWGKQKI